MPTNVVCYCCAAVTAVSVVLLIEAATRADRLQRRLTGSIALGCSAAVYCAFFYEGGVGGEASPRSSSFILEAAPFTLTSKLDTNSRSRLRQSYNDEAAAITNVMNARVLVCKVGCYALPANATVVR